MKHTFRISRIALCMLLLFCTVALLACGAGTPPAEPGFPTEGSEGLSFTPIQDGTAYAVSGMGTCTDTEVVIAATYNGLPVTTIGEEAFKACKSLESITLSEGIVQIEGHAFGGCTALRSVTLPDSLTHIGWGAFYGCTSLKNLTLPNSVTELGEGAFYNCTSLKNFTLSNGIAVIRGDLCSGCTSLPRITLPEGVTEIAEHAFQYCSYLTTVNLPDSITRIGGYAFDGCSTLRKLTIPDHVTSIGSHAFDGCLCFLVTEDGVSYAGRWAVACDPAVTAVTLRSDTVGLAEHLFQDCAALTDITFSGTVAQWEAIRKEAGWIPAAGCTVHCTDGDISR